MAKTSKSIAKTMKKTRRGLSSKTKKSFESAKKFVEKLQNKAKNTLKRRTRKRIQKKRVQKGGAVRMPMEYFDPSRNSRISEAGLSVAGGGTEGFTWNDFSAIKPASGV